MYFHHEHLDGLDCTLEQINEETGRRYRTPGGNVYPSITTVLGSIKNKELEAWRERVGNEYANKFHARLLVVAQEFTMRLKNIC